MGPTVLLLRQRSKPARRAKEKEHAMPQILNAAIAFALRQLTAAKRRFGHQLPRRQAMGVAALPPITDTKTNGRRGS